MRAQTTLPALGVALVVLTAVTGVALAMGDAAVASGDRSPDERRTAAAAAATLVAADGPLATRDSVLDRDSVASFDGETLVDAVPPASEYDTRVELDGREIASRGDPAGGTTIRRIVRVSTRTSGTLDLDATTGTTLTLPRRTERATVRIHPPNGTTIWTVRAGDRVVLHDTDGLNGTFTVALDPYETTQLRFQTAGRLAPGNVTVGYEAPRTTKATLAVTVDA